MDNHVNAKQSYSWFHLKYFYALVVLSFVVVTIPMAATVVTGFNYVDKLTNQSQKAVSRAVKTTQLSRILVSHSTSMERTIRQYIVLKNDSLLIKYYSWHGKFLQTAKTLQENTLSEPLKAQLATLSGMEADLFEKVSMLDNSKKSDKINPQDFIALSELSQAILNDSDRLIDVELDIMDEISNRARNDMNALLIWMLPVSVAFIMWFTRLIANPILQLDKQIRLLGNQRFDQKIVVKGPRDLRALGQRLDWLREQLSYMETMKTEFLQSVSHELKTPLTAIRESAELLSEELAGPLTDKQMKICSILQKNSVSLQKMIEKLLSFNMNHSAREEGSRKNVYLVQLLEQVLDDHEAIILSKNLKITKNVENWIYQANEEEIRVVMDNLLSNAVKYAPIDSTIEISLCGKQNELVLDVRDQGVGISAKDRKRVFEEFYRGAPAEKGVIKGSGLGLFIAKEIVEAHKGQIELLDEEPLRKGAHFRVRLPLATDEELAWVV